MFRAVVGYLFEQTKFYSPCQSTRVRFLISSRIFHTVCNRPTFDSCLPENIRKSSRLNLRFVAHWDVPIDQVRRNASQVPKEIPPKKQVEVLEIIN